MLWLQAPGRPLSGIRSGVPEPSRKNPCRSRGAGTVTCDASASRRTYSPIWELPAPGCRVCRPVPAARHALPGHACGRTGHLSCVKTFSFLVFLVLVLDPRGSRGTPSLFEFGDGVADVAHQHVGHVRATCPGAPRYALRPRPRCSWASYRREPIQPLCSQFGLQVEQRPLGLLVVLRDSSSGIEQRVDDLRRVRS